MFGEGEKVGLRAGLRAPGTCILRRARLRGIKSALGGYAVTRCARRLLEVGWPRYATNHATSYATNGTGTSTSTHSSLADSCATTRLRTCKPPSAGASSFIEVVRYLGTVHAQCMAVTYPYSRNQMAVAGRSQPPSAGVCRSRLQPVADPMPTLCRDLIYRGLSESSPASEPLLFAWLMSRTHGTLQLPSQVGQVFDRFSGTAVSRSP